MSSREIQVAASACLNALLRTANKDKVISLDAAYRYLLGLPPSPQGLDANLSPR